MRAPEVEDPKVLLGVAVRKRYNNRITHPTILSTTERGWAGIWWGSDFPPVLICSIAIAAMHG